MDCPQTGNYGNHCDCYYEGPEPQPCCFCGEVPPVPDADDTMDDSAAIHEGEL